MAKYTPELVKVLCDNIANGFTIAEACKDVNINKQTFYNWLADTKIDFLDHYKKAEAKKLELLKQERKEIALKGLNYLLNPYIYDEVTTIERHTETGFTKEVKTTTKTIMPNATALIFALSNDLPDQFKRADKPADMTETDTNQPPKINFND